MDVVQDHVVAEGPARIRPARAVAVGDVQAVVVRDRVVVGVGNFHPKDHGLGNAVVQIVRGLEGPGAVGVHRQDALAGVDGGAEAVFRVVEDNLQAARAVRVVVVRPGAGGGVAFTHRGRADDFHFGLVVFDRHFELGRSRGAVAVRHGKEQAADGHGVGVGAVLVIKRVQQRGLDGHIGGVAGRDGRRGNQFELDHGDAVLVADQVVADLAPGESQFHTAGRNPGSVRAGTQLEVEINDVVGTGREGQIDGVRILNAAAGVHVVQNGVVGVAAARIMPPGSLAVGDGHGVVFLDHVAVAVRDPKREVDFLLDSVVQVVRGLEGPGTVGVDRQGALARVDAVADVVFGAVEHHNQAAGAVGVVGIVPVAGEDFTFGDHGVAAQGQAGNVVNDHDVDRGGARIAVAVGQGQRERFLDAGDVGVLPLAGVVLHMIFQVVAVGDMALARGRVVVDDFGAQRAVRALNGTGGGAGRQGQDRARRTFDGDGRQAVGGGEGEGFGDRPGFHAVLFAAVIGRAVGILVQLAFMGHEREAGALPLARVQRIPGVQRIVVFRILKVHAVVGHMQNERRGDSVAVAVFNGVPDDHVADEGTSGGLGIGVRAVFMQFERAVFLAVGIDQFVVGVQRQGHRRPPRARRIRRLESRRRIPIDHAQTACRAVNAKVVGGIGIDLGAALGREHAVEHVAAHEVDAGVGIGIVGAGNRNVVDHVDVNGDGAALGAAVAAGGDFKDIDVFRRVAALNLAFMMHGRGEGVVELHQELAAAKVGDRGVAQGAGLAFNGCKAHQGAAGDLVFDARHGDGGQTVVGGDHESDGAAHRGAERSAVVPVGTGGQIRLVKAEGRPVAGGDNIAGVARVVGVDGTRRRVGLDGDARPEAVAERGNALNQPGAERAVPPKVRAE